MQYTNEISSPGLGTTAALLSSDPLATEGEATEGPDDEVPRDLHRANMGERGVQDFPAFDDEFGVPREFDLPELRF